MDSTPSVILLPIKVPLLTLEKIIERELKEGGVLYESDDFLPIPKEVSLLFPVDQHIVVRKSGKVRLAHENDKLEIHLPLSLRVKTVPRNALMPKMQTFESEAELVAVFETPVELTKDWVLQTSPKVKRYEWKEQLKIQLMGLKMDLGQLINTAVADLLTELIPKFDFSSELDIKSEVKEVWKQLHSPWQVYDSPDLWVRPSLEDAKWVSMGFVEDRYELVFLLHAYVQARVGEPPAKPQKIKKLPPARSRLTDRTLSEVHLPVAISYDKAKSVAEKRLLNERYNIGGSELAYVTVQEVDLYKEDKRLVVAIDVTGFAKATIYLKGIPAYKNDQQLFYMEDVEFDVKTNNRLLQFTNWLLPYTLTKMLRQRLRFKINDKLAGLREVISEHLSALSIADDFSLHGELTDLGVTEVYLTDNGVEAIITAKGDISVLFGDASSSKSKSA